MDNKLILDALDMVTASAKVTIDLGEVVEELLSEYDSEEIKLAFDKLPPILPKNRRETILDILDDKYEIETKLINMLLDKANKGV